MLEVKNPCNIVIIDSGVQRDHPLINDLNILGAGWHNGIWIDGSIEDDIGHGTAVYTILHRMIPCANLIMLKIFGKDMQCDVEVLVEAFKKAFEYSPAIINLSCGLTYCDNITALHEICRKAVGLGIIVVSAFDNSGALSWPAAFPEVIGVDMKLELESLKTYYCIENSPVNIVCCGKKQKTAWIPSITKQVEGTSFCTPIVSGKIAHLIMEGIQPYNIWNELKKNAVKVIEAKDPISNIPLFKIKKAIIFPFNKEIHSMARYYEQLYFKIEGFYDNKLLRNVGLDLSVNYNVNLKETVHDYKDIDWQDDFDTLVLGHCNKLNKWVKFDHTEYMIKKCINYKKMFIHLMIYHNITSYYMIY